MKHIRKIPALLLSFILIISLVLGGCAATANTLESLPTATAAPSVKPLVTLAPSATPSQEVSEPLSYISIDVNPSVKLIVQNGAVTEVAAYNDDGTKIIAQTDVAGLSPEEALNIYINAFADGGYITSEGEQASLVITACGDKSDELIASLQNTAAQRLSELGLACDVVVSTVTNSIVDDAKANGLTPGRYLALKYLAEQEGITLDEAKEKYGSLKMGKLVKLLDDVDAVFGHRGDEGQLQNLVDSGILTPEQQQILTQAQNAFEAAMRQAQEAFKQARTQVQQLWKEAKTQIQNAYKADKDAEKWKASKNALKAQIEQQKQTAKETFKQVKVQAQEQFRAAVASLGLSDEQIAALIEWGFDDDWDFDFDWSHGTDTDAPDIQQDQIDEENGDKSTDELKPEQSRDDNPEKPDNSGNGEHKGGQNGKGKNS